MDFSKQRCDCGCNAHPHMGSEVFGEKGKKSRVPNKQEVREAMRK